ncbi:MAG TPA: CAP domain-containing protein [Thermoanaerobaculia bacterium]|nr:CAP domain-containing protein [Thermoanaerobaculia bacterium]
MALLPSSVFRLPALLLSTLLSGSDDYQATREALVDQINLIRKSASASPLRLSPALCAVAQERAAEIARGNSVEVPAEEDARRLTKAGYESRLVSEVEARTDGDVEAVVAAWRDAQGVPARELVGKDYREIGIGVSLEADVPLYILLFGLSWDDFFKERTAALSNLEKMRDDMLARVNKERVARKLAPLRRHPRLDEAAQRHADDMFTKRYYSHDSPDGKTAIDRIQALGYRAKYAGENIARGQYSVAEVMDGWMESQTHRDHLLSPVFDDVGFGLAFGKNPGGYEILWVQNFARPKGRERL